MEENSNAWFAAIFARDYEKIKNDLGIYKGSVNSDGLTGLHLAAQIGDVGIVRILAATEKGILTPDGLTAYMLSVINGHWEAAEFLYQFEGDIKTNRNKTILHILAERGLASELEAVAPKIPNECDCNGNTALESALLSSQIDAAGVLLRQFPLDLSELNRLEEKFRETGLSESITFIDRAVVRLEREAISRCKDCNYFKKRLEEARRDLGKQQRYCEDIKRVLLQSEGTPLDAARAAIRAFKAELEEKTKIQDALNSELRLLKSESERSKRAVVQAETQMQEIREQYISGDGRTVRDMDRIIRELTTKIESLQADNLSLEATLQNVRAQLHLRDERVLTISTQLAEQSRANSALARIHSLEKEKCNSLESQVRSLQGSLHVLEESNEQLAGTVASQEQSLNTLTTTVTQLATEKAEFMNILEAGPPEYKEMQREALEASNQLYQSIRECEELQGTVNALREAEQEYLRIIQEKTEESMRLSATIRELEADKVNLKAKISILEGQVAVYVEEIKLKDDVLGAKSTELAQLKVGRTAELGAASSHQQLHESRSSKLSMPISSVVINPAQAFLPPTNMSHLSNFSASNMSNISVNLDGDEEEPAFTHNNNRRSIGGNTDTYVQVGSRRTRPLSASAVTSRPRTNTRGRMDASLTASMLNPIAVSAIHGQPGIGMSMGTVTYKGQTQDDTLLMQAAATGDLSVIQQMAHEIRRINSNGMTALMLATLNKQRDAIINLISQESGMQNNDGETALMIAVRTGYHEGVNLLAMKEARYTKPDGTSALYIAINSNNEVAARMLARYEGIDVRDVSTLNYRFNEMMEAAAQDDIVTCYLLISLQGRLVDESGRTALMYAAMNGASSAARLLVPIQLQCRDKYGNTALMYAAELGYQDLVEILKGEAGMSNRLGETALIKAIRRGHIACVGALFFAEYSICTVRGESPIDIAASLGGEIPQEVKASIVNFLTDLQNRIRL